MPTHTALAAVKSASLWRRSTSPSSCCGASKWAEHRYTDCEHRAERVFTFETGVAIEQRLAPRFITAGFAMKPYSAALSDQGRNLHDAIRGPLAHRATGAKDTGPDARARRVARSYQDRVAGDRPLVAGRQSARDRSKPWGFAILGLKRHASRGEEWGSRNPSKCLDPGTLVPREMAGLFSKQPIIPRRDRLRATPFRNGAQFYCCGTGASPRADVFAINRVGSITSCRGRREDARSRLQNHPGCRLFREEY